MVESRPGDEDPGALALMDKLSAHSRQRWPVEELPSEWAFPGTLPNGDGHRSAPS